MWRATGACVIGTSHAANGKPCQDYCRYIHTIVGGSSVLAIAISDGAGSAQLSHVGSQATVDYLLDILPRRPIASLIDANEDFARDILKEVQGHLNLIAIDQGCDPADLACTVLLAVLGEFVSFFAQVGDGAWVMQKDGEYSVPIWPDNGEYVNETTFLSSPNWQERLGWCSAFGRISQVAGFTDGLERIGLHIATKSVFAPFFDPLFSVVRESADDKELRSALSEFLSSERVAARTDDDKTLVLACYHDPLMLQS
jgi:hypothetical protein